MARRLTNIKVNEVSSVDKGAGEGVKILLMKRDADPVIDMRGLLKSKPQELDMTEAELQKMIADAVGIVVKPLQDGIAKRDAEIAVLKMSDEENAYCDAQKMDEKGRQDFAAMSAEDRAAKMKKMDDGDPVAKAIAPIQAENVTLRKANDEMAKRLSILELDKEKDVFEKRAVDLGLNKTDGETIRKAYAGDKDAQAALDKLIKTVTTAAKEIATTAVVFKEFGATGALSADGSEPINKMWAAADVIKKAEPGLTRQQAFDKAASDPANAEIWQQIRAAEKANMHRAVA